MANNLNQAFMRAYAKDRHNTASAAEPPASAPMDSPPASRLTGVASAVTAGQSASPTQSHPATQHPQAVPSLATQSPATHRPDTETHATKAHTWKPSAPTPSTTSPSAALERLTRPAGHKVVQTQPISTLSVPSVQTPEASSPPVATRLADSPSEIQKPVSQRPEPQKSVTQPPLTQRPVTQRPVTQRPVTQRPVTQPPVTQRPVMQRPVMQPPATQRAVTQRAATQAPVTQAPVTQAPVTQPIAQSPIQPQDVTQQPVIQPSIKRQPAVEKQPAVSTYDPASDVWRRIDQAHSRQTRHPADAHPRQSVSVGTPSSKELQAVAAAPVAAPRPQSIAPALSEPPTVPTAAAVESVKTELPLTHMPASGASELQAAETRRRTVADFLYAAGQYTPGRILASVAPGSASADPGLASTGPRLPSTGPGAAPVFSAPATTAADQVHASHSSAPPIDHSAAINSAFNTAVDTAVVDPMVHPVPAAMPGVESDVAHEPLPRRMGHIVRVDIPRGAAAASSPPPAPLTTGSTPTEPMAAVALDAPVAKYVQEQRRLDLAHKLNEAEEKLRCNTHKIFNPVWEVDNLQWPAVVDKLIEQRADAMAHVAAHLKSACQEGLSVLGVTSASPSEGRTTVACCLARLAALHGLHVALVDLDLDRPTLCLQTNMEVEQDWRDALNEQITFEEVAVHSLDDQLTVFPLKPRGTRPGLLASDGRLAKMLREISESFELVIVDCARTSSSGNVITGLAHTKIFDAAIVVVDRRQTEPNRVEDAVRLVQQTGIESIGIVDNFSV